MAAWRGFGRAGIAALLQRKWTRELVPRPRQRENREFDERGL